MNVNNVSVRRGKDIVWPCVNQFVHILLVDHDMDSLMSIASQFEQQLYKVTPTQSATIALSLFEERNNYYDIVIANICMPEMSISEFAEKLQRHSTLVPIIATSENLTMDSVEKAIDSGVCYVFSKPLSHRNIATVWQHIPRVTGKMPAFFNMTNNFDKEKDGNTSSGAAARNQNTDMKRKNIQIAQTPDSSTDHDEEIDCNSKKPRISWNSDLHHKFLQAINFLGEHEAQPQTILIVMNEPGLTYRQVASHLQIYRKERRQSFLNMQNTFARGNLAKNQEAAGHLIPEIGRLSINGWEGLNQEPANACSGYEIPASSHLNNGLQVAKEDSVGASTYGIPPQPSSSPKMTQTGEE